MFDNLIRVLQIPNRVEELETMAQLTQAALVELSNAIDEVAGELDELTQNNENMDADTAAQISAAANRLRGLRPETPPEGEVDPNEPAQVV